MKTIEVIKKQPYGTYIVKINNVRWEVDTGWLNYPAHWEQTLSGVKVKLIADAVSNWNREKTDPVCLDLYNDELEVARRKIEELETTLGHMRMEENNSLNPLMAFLDVVTGKDKSSDKKPFSHTFRGSEVFGEPPLKNPSGDDKIAQTVFELSGGHPLVEAFVPDYSKITVPEPLNIIPASHVENNPLGGLMPKVGSKWKSNLNGHEFEVIYSSDIVILFYHDDDLCYHLKSIPDKVFAEMKPVK